MDGKRRYNYSIVDDEIPKEKPLSINKG